MPVIHAVDLSHWNTVTSFLKVREAGVVGVVHKATEGKSYVDKTYATRRPEAAAAGLSWGAYHFLKHGAATAQMQHFVKYAKLPPGSRGVIDYEDQACTLDDLREAVRALQATDSTMQICIYAGGLLKGQLGSQHDPLLAQCSLWLAHYTSGAPTWPTGTWKTWSLWQYTDGEQGGQPREVPGTKAPIDCNTFNGSAEQCAKWFGPSDQPGPTPQPSPEAPIVMLTVQPGTVIVINGQAVTAS